MPSLLFLHLLNILLFGVLSEPAPGRIPKVYNALITSNQNLEPSKSYPVYQPVLHDAFAFSYQPAFFYGGDLFGNGILSSPALTPKEQPKPDTTSQDSASETPTETSPSSTENANSTPEFTEADTDTTGQKSSSTPAPPSPPVTQSPIPLNEFGLPPQVIPLSHIDPTYNALPHFNPFTYRYPSLRFYDPYDPFSFSPYTSFSSIYQPLPSLIGHSLPIIPKKQPVTPAATSEPTAQTPPPEPNDLNVLNYSSKDPAIPNVPPPPLPQGGLKSDKPE